MPSPLVITAFSSFPGVPENPTEALLRSLPECGDPVLADARHILLPTLYDVAPERLMEALTPMPRAILMTGYSHRATGIVLERRAMGTSRPDRPDADGYCPPPASESAGIIENAIDIATMATHLTRAGISTELSDDAGAYVCNHLYHAALSGPCSLPGGPIGLFVHLPALPGTALSENAAATMDLATMRQGLGILARTLLEHAE